MDDSERGLSRLALATTLWALGFGALQTGWAISGRPHFPPIGIDLYGVNGVWTVIACGVVVLGGLLLTTGLGSSAIRWTLAVATGAVGLAIAASAALIVLDLVAHIFPGVGIPSSWGGFATRAAAVTTGVLAITTAVVEQRKLRGVCTRCGRHHGLHSSDAQEVAMAESGAVLGTREGRHASAALPGVPRWAYIAGWVAVAGCAARFGAQAFVGFGPEGNPYANASAVAGLAFVGAMALAGTLLPLALIHRWGRVWPFWVLGLAGRKVPRWLVLGPAFAVSVGMTAYFGMGSIGEALDGGSGEMTGQYPAWFSWVPILAYLMWGIGLGIAAISYFRLTRPRCPRDHAALADDFSVRENAGRRHPSGSGRPAAQP